MKFATLAVLPVLASANVLNYDAVQVAGMKSLLKTQPHLMARRFWRSFAESKTRFSTEETSATPPATTVPVRTEKPGVFFPQAKRVTIRYGPYLLPSANQKTAESALLKINGVANTFKMDADKPCTECTILALDADLQYADGSPATTETGAWLHHTGMVNTGAGLIDPMCGMPGFENFFEEGNERSQTFYGNNGTIKAGLKIKPANKFFLLNEFVNMKDQPQWVWIAYNYELMDGKQPDYRKSHYLLLSVGPSCNTKMMGMYGPSNLTLAGYPKSRVFDEHSIPWISPFDGTVLGTGGHLHDGGLDVKVYQNNKMICDSEAVYGNSPDSEGAAMEKSGGMPMSSEGGAMGGAMGGGAPMHKRDGPSYGNSHAHIERMTACATGEPIHKGDQVRLVAQYNFNDHPGMMDNQGKLDEVMGMAGFLLAENSSE